MRAVALAILILAAFAVPPAEATTLQERNLAFLWSLVGDTDPMTPTTLPDGRVVPLHVALDESALRAGHVDLAALASGAIVGPGVYVGDVWLLSFGTGGCSIVTAAPQPIFFGGGPQTWIYSGHVGKMSGDAFWLLVFDWTGKRMDAYIDAHWEAVGAGSMYCITFGNFHIAFPFVNGIVTVT